MARLRRVVLERLMRYYRWLTESSFKKPLKNVTSAQIAEALDVDPTQVRKDFGAIGLLGMGRVGFEVCEVCRGIRHVLGFDQPYEGVMIGAGRLGSALAAYKNFARYGLEIVAVFDNDKRKIGGKVAGRTVQSMRALKPFIRRHEIRLAILTTPAEVSQKVVDRLVSAGVKAIWNFAPVQVTVPPDVLVRNEHISLGLSEIAYHLTQLADPPEAPKSSTTAA
ncbi:MAG: redox-sensing transcriptional repressor Rex [Gemmatimonadota bacterium]|nr:MAG: redox-sensing transcriptional repressor Rex [Gemmatimonadota bacterium]